MGFIKFLLFLTVPVHLSSAACSHVHHLQFSFTENTAEALLDGEQFVYYDKSKENVIPTAEWMKRNNDSRDWEDLNNKLKDGLQCGRDFVGTTVSSFSQTEGNQMMYGCTLYNGTESGYWKFGYDGKYFLSLNLKAGAWTAVNDKSEAIKQKMEKESNLQKAFLQDECIPWLKKFISYKDSWSQRHQSAEENASPSRVTHSVQFFYTAVTGINFPEFTAVSLVDGQQISYYDSKTRKKIPKTDWIEKVVDDEAGYWDRTTQILQVQQERFKVNVQTAMQRFNHTKGVHTVQVMYGCELDDDGTKRGYFQHGYDGEDFLSLDLKTGAYVAPVPQAVSIKQKLDSTGQASVHKNYLENSCIEWLVKYVGYGKSVLERKVRPEVDLFSSDSSSPVVCHATGFFPKGVMITWQKNGEELNEDVDLREMLTNQDGTFQKRSILTLSPEELKNGDKYTCVVQHGGLEKDVALKVSERRILSDRKSGVPVGLIIAVVAAALIVIIAIVGVVVWKKKNGFKLVPPHPPSDSSSNNS